MKSFRRLLLAACAAAPMIAACDGRAGSMPSSGDGYVGLAPSTPLIDRMVAAPNTVRFQGERHVESHWRLGNTPYDLEYRERVSADGQGQFSIEPLDLVEPSLPPGQENLFLVLSRAREGFYYRYRNFRIQHLPTFLRNYHVQDSGQTVQVLGRDCAQLTVRRIHDAEVVYHLAVDTLTGLVLRCREVARDGTLLGLAEYESLDLTPDLSQVAWHQSVADESDLADPQHPIEVGTGAHAPSFVQDSMVLLSAKELSVKTLDVDEHFARYTYTDGLEVVFLMYGGGNVDTHAAAASPEDLVQIPPSVGPWQVLVANIHGERLIAMGRLSQNDLLDLIVSALY